MGKQEETNAETKKAKQNGKRIRNRERKNENKGR